MTSEIMTSVSPETAVRPNYVRLNAGEVFFGNPSNTEVRGWDAPSLYTPQVDEGFILPPWGADLIMWFIHSTDPLYITGPTGAGKSSAVRFLAGKLNYPVYEITGHNRLETPELVGHFALRAGSTEWVDGPLTAAMRQGGIFLLNEIDLLDPSTATGLNTILDGAPLCIAETAEVVHPHEGFRFVATANTNGSGDEAGLYTGTLRQNVAFQNRFLHVEADYLPAKYERQLLRAKYPSLPESVTGSMVKVATLCRQMLGSAGAEGELDEVTRGFLPDGTVLTAPMSTRTLLRWAHWTLACEPLAKRGMNVLEKALDIALANGLDKTTKNTLHELLQRVVCAPSQLAC